jgi:hypothetical protein
MIRYYFLPLLELLYVRDGYVANINYIRLLRVLVLVRRVLING